MGKFYLSKDVINDLHAERIFLTALKPADSDGGRIGREYSYPEGCMVGRGCGLKVGTKFPARLGSYSYSRSALETYFSIGNYCSIAAGLRVITARHPMERFTTSSITYDAVAPMFNHDDFTMRKTPIPPPWTNELRIEHDVWIGDNVTLKKGITLHTGCVVGTNSLVTHDVPPYAVVGGVPARIIKYRFDPLLIKKLLESRWYEYDVNYLQVKSDIYVYDFLKAFEEHREELPRLEMMKLGTVLEELPSKVAFRKRIDDFVRTGKFVVSKDEIQDEANFQIILETLYVRKLLENNMQNVEQMCLEKLWRWVLYKTFLRMEQDKRIVFFCTKDGSSIWMHYMPYLEHAKSADYVVPVWSNGLTWPSADRVNTSALAAFIRLAGREIFLSVEFAAKDMVKARALAKAVGYEEKISTGSIIRFLTKRFHFKDINGMPQAVNVALDEFCKVGEKVVAALDGLQT